MVTMAGSTAHERMRTTAAEAAMAESRKMAAIQLKEPFKQPKLP